MLDLPAVASDGAVQNSERRPGIRERNDRLIAVPVDARRCDAIRDVDDLPAAVRDELESFSSPGRAAVSRLRATPFIPHLAFLSR